MDSRDFNPDGLPAFDTRQNPLPAPITGVHDSPFMRLDINEFWWAHISGQVCRLLERDAWAGTDDDIDAAIANVAKILNFGKVIDHTSFWDDSTVPGSFSADTSIELGVKFKTTVPGYITGLRFYKDPASSAVHRGRLWTNDGTLLGDLEYNTESASGWQNAYFGNPIAIDADTVYVTSYFAVDGHFAYDWYYFNTELDRTPLIAPAAADVDIGNGVYFYGDLGGFPDQTSANNTNYWADVIFSETGA